MAKDPAVLLYTGDFLNGCADLTMDERGQYITLLCLQHQKGHLSEKTIRLSVGLVSVDVMAKFKKDEAGNYFNVRMESESEKRAKFTESRRVNGLAGGRPINNKPKAKPKQNHKDKHKDNLMENENINENKDINANELEKRKIAFAKKVSELGVGLENKTLMDFCKYWCEHNDGGKKMRFEMETVFDISRRLGTWKINENKFNKNGINKIPTGADRDAAIAEEVAKRMHGY